jgi:alpha-L-fucosidase
LSYYLTNEGLPNFKKWFKSIQLLEAIYNELDILINSIENTKEDKLIKELFENIKHKIIKQTESVFKYHPETIYNEWIESIKPYCFQGGLGYRIMYTSNNIPHHWCIKPEYYNIVVNIPENVIVSAIVCDKYINISEKLEIQYWN